jgi:hypothetical protein
MILFKLLPICLHLPGNPQSKKTILSILAFTVFICSAIAQHHAKDTSKIRYLQLICNAGIYKNRTSDDNNIMNGSFYNALDIRFGWRMRQNNTYRTLYRHPIFGIGFYTATFRKSEIGTPSALYGFVDFPFWNTKGNWEWVYSLAIGLSYNLNPYDKETNPMNTLIGSRQNAYVNIHGKINYHLNARLAAAAGIGFSHFSNGAYRLPNIGVNKFPLLLSAQYRLDNHSEHWTHFEKPPFIPHWNVDLYIGNGMKNYVPGGASYLKSNIGLQMMKNISLKYRIGGGFDLFFNARRIKQTTNNEKMKLSDQLSYGPFVAWEWKITEKLYIPINLGVYIQRNSKNDESTFYYERIGVRYKINDRIITGVSIKAHHTAADFLEWTVGYSFK